MLLRIIKTVCLLALIILLVFSAWLSFEFYRVSEGSSTDMFFVVEKGSRVNTIAQNLKERGVISKKWPFLLGYKLFYSNKSLKAGEYQFHLPLSPKDILNILIEGSVYLHPITIPEGLTRKEISQHLDSEGFVRREDFWDASTRTEGISSLDEEASDLEGYLFPETYHFPQGTPAKKLTEAMVSQFKKTFNENWQNRAREIRMSVREVVILASLIEKETSVPEERTLVSAVFHNRLNRGMKLDCDPTIIYALKQQDRFTDRLRTKDLRLDSPYNTYLYPGLPPGPICNPGRDAIEAALYPAPENYLYFVSKNDGSHHFSYTLREHLRAVQKYQK